MQIFADIAGIYEPFISIAGVHLLLFQLPRQPIILIPLVIQIVCQYFILHVYFVFDQSFLLDNLVLFLDICEQAREIFTLCFYSLELKSHLLKSSLHLFVIDLHSLNSVLIKATLIFHQIVYVVFFTSSGCTKMHLRSYGRLLVVRYLLGHNLGRWRAGF